MEDTNYDAIRKMTPDELGQFLEDLSHYSDGDYDGWKSDLKPLLPFEDWRAWLDRMADR